MTRFLSIARTMSFAAVSLISFNIFAQGTPVVSKPAGFVRAQVSASGQSLLSLPFAPFNANVNSLFSEQLTGAAEFANGDKIVKWNSATQAYITAFKAANTGDSNKDGKFFLDSTNWVPANMSLCPGEAFWAQNVHAAAQNVYLFGRVPMDETIDVSLAPGMNLFAYPYTAKIGINSTSLKNDGAFGAATQNDNPDVINKVSPEASFWLKALANDPLDGKWLDASNVLATESFKIGSGYWFNRRGTGSFTWREGRPYTNIFASSGLPEISAISLAANDGGVIVNISCSGIAGETLDIMYQDLTADGSFVADGNWKIAARGVATNSATSINWTDAGETGVRTAPNQSFGRVYAVCRGDFDADADGISDGVEAFVFKSNPNSSDSDGDGLTDGAEAFTHHTNPAAADSDADGYNDNSEINTYHTDPNDAASSPSALPTDWVTQDVGTVGMAGSCLHYDNKYVVSGAGNTLLSTSDAMRVVGSPIYGDFEFSARLAAFSGSSTAKAGLMLRTSLDSASAYAMIYTSGAGANAIARRSYATASVSSLSLSTGNTQPQWFKVTRVGTTVSYYMSADGSAWTLAQSDTLPLASAAYALFAVTANSTNALVQAEFDNVTLVRNAPIPASNGDVMSFIGDSYSVTLSSPLADSVIRYTLDGSAPTTSSAVYSAPLSMSATTNLRAQVFKADWTASPVVDGFYLKGVLPGLMTKVVTGSANDFSQLDGTALWMGISRQIYFPVTTANYAITGTNSNFSIRYTGQILIKTAGDYTFYLTSDDGSALYIDGTKVIDHSGSHGPYAKTVTLTLTKGLHALKVNYNQIGATWGIYLNWAGPGFTQQLMPQEVFFNTDSDRDGLPDDYEINRYGDLSSDGSADTDSDSFSDANELGLYLSDMYGATSVPYAAVSAPSDAQAGLIANYYKGPWSRKPYYDLINYYKSSISAALNYTATSEYFADSGYKSTVGARFTGYICAPVDSNYTFYITHDRWADFYLDGQNLLTTTDLGAHTVNVPLRAGWHAIKMDFFRNYNPGVMTLEWAYKEHGREMVPASMFCHSEAAYTEANANCDTDGDGLSNAQETAAGTSSTLADTDGDGLSDYEEINIYGTNPLAADSDNDGVNDFVEAKVAFTNPLVADFNGNNTTLQSLNGSAASAMSADGWGAEGTVMVSQERNGWLEYSLAIPADGVYRLDVSVAQGNMADTSSTYPLDLYIDGAYSGSRTAACTRTAGATLSFYLPQLATGSHTARIVWTNVDAGNVLKIVSLSLISAGGPDADANGVKDWVDNRLAKLCEAKIPATSLVSPLCIEGAIATQELTDIAVTGYYVPEGEDDIPPVIRRAANSIWFADAALSPVAATSLTVSIESGAKTATKSCTWTPANVLSNGTLKIRLNDSLILAAIPPENTPPGTVAISIDNVACTLDEANHCVRKFESAGTFTVTATYTPNDNSPAITGTMTVKVIAASFASSPVCLPNSNRLWDNAGMPYGDDDISLELDTKYFSVLSAALTPSGTRFTLVPHAVFDGSPYLVGDGWIDARAGENGPIIDATQVSILGYASNKLDGYFKTLATYADGTQLIEGNIVLSRVPEDITVVVSVWTAGTTFEDGTLTKTFTAADFNENGELTYRFIKSPTVKTTTCHGFVIYQSGVIINN